MSVTNWFKRGPKLGTPENPEIIEPGQEYRRPQERALRFPLMVSLLRMMFMVSLPVILLDAACVWLWNQAFHEGSALAGLLLVFGALPALGLNIMALIANLFFTLALVAGLKGKQMPASFVSFRGSF